MLQKQLLSLFLSSSMLMGTIPAVSAQDGTADGVTVNEQGAQTREITFTEYNDKDGGMYEVCGVNRLEPRTDSAIPYQDEATALASARDYAKETSERVKFLSGDNSANTWDISVVKNLEMGAERGLINADGTENLFAAVDFREDDTWKKDVPVPSSWTSYGEWWNNVNTPDGEDTVWVWDFPIYNNVKMPWQAGEQPYKSDTDSKADMYGTLTPGEAPVKYNPIGFYRTTFNTDGLTQNEGDRVVISFQGVESAYYVFVNGQTVGYSEDTFRGHEFDITDYLVEGENSLAVRVHKFCDATWLEDQDMIYDGGIFRDVYLISLPSVSIEDYKIETDFDENYDNADLIVKGLEVRNNTGNDVPAGYTVSAKLYDIDDFSAPVVSMTFTSDKSIPAGSSVVFDEKRVTVDSPRQWSAEKPELYALSLNLSDEDNEALESSALLVGFREIEYTMTEVDSANKNITDSYGRITINGQPLLMKGTNRHDTDPIAGKYVSKELYDTDLKTMKQYNINTIRTSHYANDEYLYYLADTQGFYLMAETNAECHAIANKDRNTAEVYQTILRPMFMDRTKTAYETLKNHSSIVSWSIGNECGGTSDANKPVYDEMVKYFHDNDPTRFVHSEFMGSNGTVDVMSNMYPGVETVEKWAVSPDNIKDSNKASMPYFICEYVHAMGNAVGDLEGYMDAVRSGTNMIGACVWDWVDQSRIVPLSRVTSEDGAIHKTDSNSNIVPNPYDYYKDGEYLANEDLFGKLREGYFYGYGGDWGDINFEGRNVAADGSASGSGSGSFCVNGLVSPDRQVQPELYEVKYQYQSFWMTETPTYEQRQLENGWTTDDNLKAGQIVVYNENNFTNLNEYDMSWTLTQNGEIIGSGRIDDLPSVEPKKAGKVSIPFSEYIPKSYEDKDEFYLYVEINEKKDTWAYKAGHEIAHEQFKLTDEIINALNGADITESVAADVSGRGISVTEDSEKFTVKGSDFSFNVSKKTGFLSDYVYKNETLIQQIIPNYTRDNHNNDSPMIDNWRYANEEKNIEAIPNTIGCSVGDDGRYVIDVGMKLTVDYSGPEYAKAFLRYVVDQSGAVTYRMYLDTTDMPRQTADGRFVLRLGSEIKLDGDYENITWYGNGIKTGTDGEYGYKYPVPESYRERDTFAAKGIYSSTATDMFFPHLDTQETGTVNNVTWAVMDSESRDTALLVTSDETYKGKETDPNYIDNTLEVSALHYSTKDLRNGTKHPYELTSSSSYTQESNVTYFNVDHKSLGIGNASCGPQAREDARINTGYIFDYEYIFVPTSKSSTDTYTQLSKAWRSTESTDVEDPEFAIELGKIGYTTLSAGLPSNVTVDGESRAVTWDQGIADCETYEDTAITGVLDDKTVVTGEICVYPDNMYYFVDCNDDDPTEYSGVKSVSPALKNENADKTEYSGGWGMSSGEGSYGDPKDKSIDGNKYTSGWYLNGSTPLEYTFELEAGKYSVVTGSYEFWNGNAARNMKLTVKTADGTELGTDTATINTKDGALQDKAKMEAGFTLDEKTEVIVSIGKVSGADPVLSWIGISQAVPYTVNVPDGITAEPSTAYAGDKVTLSGSYAAGSLFAANTKTGANIELTSDENGTYSFVMPMSDVSITGLVNDDNITYVVPSAVQRVNGGDDTDTRNYFIGPNRALGMVFEIPEVSGKIIEKAEMHFVRQNTATNRTTNIYNQSENDFTYENGTGYIAQYNGGTINALELSETTEAGKEYKLLFAYDSSVASSSAGNDYYSIDPVDSKGAAYEKATPTEVSQLPYLILTLKDGGEIVPTEEPTSIPTQEPENNSIDRVIIGGVDYSIDSELPENGYIEQVVVTCSEPKNIDGCVVYTAVYKDGVLCALSADVVQEEQFENGMAVISVGNPVSIEGTDITAAVFIWDGNGKPKAGGFKLK